MRVIDFNIYENLWKTIMMEYTDHHNYIHIYILDYDHRHAKIIFYFYFYFYFNFYHFILLPFITEFTVFDK